MQSVLMCEPTYHLLLPLCQGKLGSRWKDIATAAVGQAVLHLTKVSEGARVPQPGIFSQTVRTIVHGVHRLSLYVHGKLFLQAVKSATFTNHARL